MFRRKGTAPSWKVARRPWGLQGTQCLWRVQSGNSGKSQQGPALRVVLVGRGTEELCPYPDSNGKCLLTSSGCHEIGFDALQSSLWQLRGELTRGA